MRADCKKINEVVHNVLTLSDRSFIFDSSVLSNVFKVFISGTELAWSLKPGPCCNDTVFSNKELIKKQERGKSPIHGHY